VKYKVHFGRIDEPACGNHGVIHYASTDPFQITCGACLKSHHYKEALASKLDAPQRKGRC
jgi:hypothetical protein